MSEVGLVHNEMRFEAYRGGLLNKYAMHTHFIASVRTFVTLRCVLKLVTGPSASTASAFATYDS